MSWDYELANALKERRTGSPAIILEGTIEAVSPLTVSLYGGEIMAPPAPLAGVFCAQGFYRDKDSGHLFLEPWKAGDKAVCCWMGQTLVILGRKAAPDKQIEVR